MREKNKINGWIIIDKPYEMGSTDVVSRLKWALKPEKIGHAGTLDPLATGVLPIALGSATKTIPYVMDGAKTYEFTVSWGVETSTDDIEGEIVSQSDLRPTLPEIESILPQFTGDIMQTPPIYSAIKINGKRSYDLARAGNEVQLTPRPIRIDSLCILSHTNNATTFQVECGKGTYIRSLGHDMGRILGCFGHITHLRRTKCGPFLLSQSILLDNFKNIVYTDDAFEIIPVLAALDDILELAVNSIQAQALVQGKRLSARQMLAHMPNIMVGTVLKAVFNNQLIALVKYEAGAIKPFRVFTNTI